jgi:hypothetical protein
MRSSFVGLRGFADIKERRLRHPAFENFLAGGAYIKRKGYAARSAENIPPLSLDWTFATKIKSPGVTLGDPP